jgi:hypothetical protein
MLLKLFLCIKEKKVLVLFIYKGKDSPFWGKCPKTCSDRSVNLGGRRYGSGSKLIIYLGVSDYDIFVLLKLHTFQLSISPRQLVNL